MRSGSCSAPATARVASPPLALQSYRSDSQQDGQLRLTASVATQGAPASWKASGNGLLSAAAHGLSRWINAPFVIKDYHEHTLGERSDSRSVAYIRCLFGMGPAAGAWASTATWHARRFRRFLTQSVVPEVIAG